MSHTKQKFVRILLILVLALVGPVQLYAATDMDFMRLTQEESEPKGHCDMEKHAAGDCCKSECKNSCGGCSSCGAHLMSVMIIPASQLAFATPGFESYLPEISPHPVSPDPRFRPPANFA